MVLRIDSEFDNLLLQIDGNRENFDELINIVKSRSPIVPLLGSGINKICGLPSWSNLLSELCKILSDYPYESLTGDNWDKASQITKQYEKRKLNINKEIQNQLTPSTTNYSRLHTLILKSEYRFILTTNFDNIFSKARVETQRHGNDQYYPEFDPFNLKNGDIIYLHGNVFESNEIIFTKEQYEEAYNKYEDDLFQILDFLVWKNTILFTGFSFDDEYFKNMYLKAKDNMETHKHRTSPPEDYILLTPKYKHNKLDKEDLAKKIHYYGNTLGLKTIFLELVRGEYINIENLYSQLYKLFPVTEFFNTGRDA